MEIIAIDPGLTIGLAYLDAFSGYFKVMQTDSPVLAMEQVKYWRDHYGAYDIICENYNSAGHLTKEAKETIKIVGLFEYGISAELVSPQARLSSVGDAERLAADDVVDMYRKGRDAIAALAHAISYAREHDGR